MPTNAMQDIAQQGRYYRDYASGASMSQFGKGYTSFSGSDIKCMFGGVPFAELQALSYSIEREKAGVWTLGQVAPRSYTRGKRAIAGTFIAVNFDRNALLDIFDYTGGFFISDSDDVRPDFKSPDSLNSFRLYAAGSAEAFSQGSGYVDNETMLGKMPNNPLPLNPDTKVSDVGPDSPPEAQESALKDLYDDQIIAHAWHADQILPFNIAVAANNEYGAGASMKIFGVEILNETSGFSVDDMVQETHWTFIAREMGPWQPSTKSRAVREYLYQINNNAGTEAS